jgi:hypothetical protein
MGLTGLTLEVANPAAPEFLIDSGAVYSFVPREVLERLGIQPHSQQRVRLADGSTIDPDRGDALFFHGGQRGAAPVIFAEPGDATQLGAVSLEGARVRPRCDPPQPRRTADGSCRHAAHLRDSV